jgi:hypothetical protein
VAGHGMPQSSPYQSRHPDLDPERANGKWGDLLFNRERNRIRDLSWRS